MNASAAPLLLADEPREILEAIELPVVPLLPKAFATESRRDDLATAVRSLLDERDLDSILDSDPTIEEELLDSARSLAKSAYPRHRTTARQTDSWIDHDARDAMHRALLVLYQQHLSLIHISEPT